VQLSQEVIGKVVKLVSIQGVVVNEGEVIAYCEAPMVTVRYRPARK
jgi:hypothetical protein